MQTHQRTLFRLWILLFTLLVFYGIRSNREAISTNHQLIVKVKDNAAKINRNQRAAVKRGKQSRIDIAQSDLALCTKIFKRVIATQEDLRRQATFSRYRRLLPGFSDQAIRALLKETLAQIAKTEKAYDPEKCHDLPSQKFLPKKGQT